MNSVCALLGIRYPIIEGGLAYVGNGLLAAAVSEAGGLGQVGSGGRTAADFRSEIQTAIKETNKPFGANIPLSEHHDSTPYLAVVEEFRAHLTAVSLSAGNPRPFVSPLKELGLRVMTLASTPVQAYKAQVAGVDIVICEGAEAGGHNGPSELSTLVLVPAVKHVVTVPVVAAGGISNGRQAAALFRLGADGIQMGTRFVATEECAAHENYKEALVQGHAEDTVIMERSLGRATRVLQSPFVNRILQQERETPGNLDKLLPLIGGKHNYAAAVAGHLDDGYVNCGQSVEFIEEILPAADVIEIIVSTIQMEFESDEQPF